MSRKDTLYKSGIWRMESAEKDVFNKDRLILTLIDKLKTDIENNDPSDKKSKEMINDLLYHYCWKVMNNEPPGN